jgi:TrmH family RNA methyltransferase
VGIEGPNLVREALRARLRIECVFVAEGAEQLLDLIPLEANTGMLLMPKSLLDSVQTTEAPQAIAALVEAPDWTWAHLIGSGLEAEDPVGAKAQDSLDPFSARLKSCPVTKPVEFAPDANFCASGNASPLVVILAGLQDPGNLGTILRSAEAFGADGVISLPGTVSAWNPKAVRASAGSVFRLPLLSVDAEECFLHLREADVKIWTTTVDAAEPADLVNLTGPVAFLIGNEGKGVPAELAALADGAITIPCPGPVESLNAAVAASVLLYEASRQRGGLR